MVGFIDEAVEIAREIKSKTAKLKDFREYLENDEGIKNKCEDLKTRVNAMAAEYPMPGHDQI